MKTKSLRIIAIIMSLISVITLLPISASAVSFDQIVNAATKIIISNEGNYTTVVRNDNGALSIGKLGWHATNALNLLKEIVAKNPNQALNILGISLYNEIVTSYYWETRIPTTAEASVIAILLSTTESREVQDKTAKEYIGKYVTHGMNLGITEPVALVFFADYENQNGHTGATNFYRKVINAYGVANLSTLYNTSNKSSRRTRTYNFCATINWNDYAEAPNTTPNTPTTPALPKDTTPPEISNVAVSNITHSGYTISCSASDNDEVTAILFAVFHKDDGADNAKWYKSGSLTNASFTVDISEFSNRSGDYYTYIYAFDASGNYAYVQLNVITVPTSTPPAPEFSLTISSVSDGINGGKIKWTAQAANGSGSYLYAYEIYKDGKIISKRNYNDFSDYSYIAEATGTYTATVSVRDTASNKTISATSTEIEILEPIKVNSFGANASQIFLGESICWTADITGGEGDLKYSYTVYYNDDTIVYSSDFTSERQFTWTPDAPGNYNVTVNIMDARSQAISAKSQNVTVIERLSAMVSFSQDYAVVGKTISLSANVSGGTGNYTCAFTIFYEGEPVLVSETSNTDIISFILPKSGNYTASVTVTDADNTTLEIQSGTLTVAEKAEKGDANCDGTISASDARYVLRCASDLEKIENDLMYTADVNEDGELTASDARRILRVSVEIDTFD